MAILDCRARVAAAIIIIKCNKKGPGPLYSLGNVGLEIRSAMPLINVCSPQVYINFKYQPDFFVPGAKTEVDIEYRTG